MEPRIAHRAMIRAQPERQKKYGGDETEGALAEASRSKPDSTNPPGQCEREAEVDTDGRSHRCENQYTCLKCEASVGILGNTNFG